MFTCRSQNGGGTRLGPCDIAVATPQHVAGSSDALHLNLDHRESLAGHYLRDSSLSTIEIALLLGYDEPSSFYRAYHAWTGQTPAQARATAR